MDARSSSLEKLLTAASSKVNLYCEELLRLNCGPELTEMCLFISGTLYREGTIDQPISTEYLFFLEPHHNSEYHEALSSMGISDRFIDQYFFTVGPDKEAIEHLLDCMINHHDYRFKQGLFWIFTKINLYSKLDSTIGPDQIIFNDILRYCTLTHQHIMLNRDGFKLQSLKNHLLTLEDDLAHARFVLFCNLALWTALSVWMNYYAMHRSPTIQDAVERLMQAIRSLMTTRGYWANVLIHIERECQTTAEQ